MALPVMPSRTLMWRQFCQIDYRRIDGYIKASSPVDDLSPIPTAFDVHGLFQIYNLSYGLANLSDSSQFTDEIKNDIRYQTIEQATSFLATQEAVPSMRALGDHFAGSAAVRAFILPPVIDYIGSMTPDYRTDGLSMGEYYPLVIPLYLVCAFIIVCCLILIWATVVMFWSTRNKGDGNQDPAISDIYIVTNSVDKEDELRVWLRKARRSQRPSRATRVKIHWTVGNGFKFLGE